MDLIIHSQEIFPMVAWWCGTTCVALAIAGEDEDELFLLRA
jgi:hypothetical protein